MIHTSSKGKAERCLIIGGCGFIGHNVTRMCHEAGSRVEVIDTCTNYGIYPEIPHQQKILRRISRMPDVPIHRTPIEDEQAIEKIVVCTLSTRSCPPFVTASNRHRERSR